LPQPHPPGTDLLAIELRWPGADTIAALREASALIRDADLAAFIGAERPGWLARLFQLDSPYQRARRRYDQAVVMLSVTEPRLRDCLARHEAFLQRSEAAAAGCRETEARLAAALAVMQATPDAAERDRHELRLGLAVARQDSLTAAMLLDRDRGITRAIRQLLEVTLPQWHGMIADALVLRRAAGARRLLQALDPEPALRDIDGLVAAIGERR
jgi:hypothetical protein